METYYVPGNMKICLSGIIFSKSIKNSTQMLFTICILEDEVDIKRDEVICSRFQLESNGIGSAPGKKKSTCQRYHVEFLHSIKKWK